MEEYSLQENLPKILPMWHDLSVQDMMKIKCYRRYFQDKLPDYGGAGVDIENVWNELKCCVGKHLANEIKFSAHICSLPFFAPNKVSLKSDPCLLPVKASRVELKKFCVALEYLRRCANKPDGKFQKELFSSIATAEHMCDKKSERKARKLFLSDTIIQLATQFPKSCQLSESNLDYLGGCMAISQTADENHILLHPVGKELNKLGVTPLVENYDSDRAFQPVYSEMKRVKLKKSCIQKISSVFPGHCFVQQGNICQHVNFSNPSNIYAKQLFRKNGCYVNIAASPYNPTEYVSIDENGILELQDIDESETLWIYDAAHSTEKLKYSKLKACTFGSHPKSLLSLIEDSVYIYDSRLNVKSGSILLSKHFSSFPEEKFLNLKHLANINPFQHLISSTHHLYVCDERYLKKPVLIWSHLFKSSPLYCDVACYDSKDSSSDAVALLGSQESRELSLFALRYPETRIQPISLSSPLLLSSPSDFIASLKLHGINVNDYLTERIMNPLIGVCVVPHSKKRGFTAFQLTSFGDVFYQDFDSILPNEAENTYRVDTGCVLSPPSKILPHISKWTDFFSKCSKENHFSRSNLVSVNVDLTDILSDSRSISSGCDLCIYNTYSLDREVVSSTSCSFCGLDNVEVEKSLEAFNNLGLLAGPVTEQPEIDCFDESALSGFNDEYSQELLKPWTNTLEVTPASSDVDDSDSCYSYGSSKSGSSRASSVKTIDNSFNATQCFDMALSQSPIWNQDETTLDCTFQSQDSFVDVVPPSQDIRPVIGETLRPTPKRPKIQLNMNTSTAGF